MSDRSLKAVMVCSLATFALITICAGCTSAPSRLILTTPIAVTAYDGVDGNSFAQAILDGSGQWLFNERAHGLEVTFATFSTADGDYDMTRPMQRSGGDFDYFDPSGGACHATGGHIEVSGLAAIFDIACGSVRVSGRIDSAL